MAVMQQNPAAASSVRPTFARPAWTTPRRLEAALAALWLLTALLLITALTGAHQHRQALQTVGREAAPSILGAQRIKAGLSGMDAAAADVLLLPPGIAQEQADDRYEARRVEVTEGLASVAQTGGGETERRAVRALAVALGTYETDVAQARLLHLRGEPGSRLVYRMTHSEMHDTLLPAADALSAASGKVLDAAYRNQTAASVVSIALLWTLGFLLLALLIVTQVFLFRRTNRLFSLPLLGAAVVTAVFVLSTSALFSAESQTLRTLKADSFASVSRLWAMRATAFDANAEESRWLMDTPQAAQYAQGYAADAGQISAALPDFPAVSPAYSGYDAADRHLRALEDGGSHAAAVTFCVGARPGEHDWAFAQLNDALGRTLGSGQSEFDAAVADGFRRQAGYDAGAAVALLLVATLTWLGLRPRLREYAA